MGQGMIHVLVDSPVLLVEELILWPQEELREAINAHEAIVLALLCLLIAADQLRAQLQGGVLNTCRSCDRHVTAISKSCNYRCSSKQVQR